MLKTKTSLRAALLGATAIAITATSIQVLAQEVAVTDPAPNTEPDTAPSANGSGFVLSLDGVPVNADPAVEDRIRRTDIALSEADVQITFDGLNPEPRLNVEVAGAARAYGPGDTITLRSEMNYPAFVARGEMLIYDRDAVGGARLLATVPVAPNGTASVLLPSGQNLVAVHRVYDSAGRYDETEPLPLGRPDDRGLTANEDGYDSTAERNIRVSGGAVTVAAANMAPGANLLTLGEAVRADGQGNAVIQRILPPGDYAVDVEVSGAGQRPLSQSRDLEVPGSEWFYVGSGELTYSGIGSDAGTETSGRLSAYVDGETANGVRVTASIDTGNGPIDEVFDRLEEHDPQSLVDRIALGDGYPTFGDDSTIVDNTPTSGRVYIRVQQDNNFALWGDFQARLSGSTFLRNERTLYGAQLHYETDDVTADGEARASLDVYAAQPDQLVGRDAFRGTSGSVYFLSRQDLTPGAATLTVEMRDADTNRVLERQTLVEGRDYTINYLQGVVTLTRPLDGQFADGLIQTNASGDVVANLVVQYEYTPIGIEVDGLSYGARIEGWVTDDLRVGVTAIGDETGAADQTAVAVDLRYEIGANSFVQLDYAETDGPGFGALLSLDGGFTLDTQATAAGEGEAVRLEAQIDLVDLGYNIDGTIGAYVEDRTEGFSSLDYQVTSVTGDELLYGGFVLLAPSDRVSYALEFDRYENGVGEERTELSAEVAYDATDRLSLAFGAEFLEENDSTSDGSRVDLAARVTYSLTDTTDVFAYGQSTVSNDGLDDFERYGIGARYDVATGWSVEGEVSDGTGGTGAQVLASYEDANNNSTYFGYELDPGRALDAGISEDDNGGRFVAGGRRVLSDRTTMFGENVYDLFGGQRSLTSSYGVEYQATDFLSYSAALAYGQIADDENGDFERTALSLGMRYADDALTARVVGEVRLDDADDTSTRSDAEVYVLSANLAYKLDETQRLIFSLSAADSESDESSVLDGRYLDVNFGYALRPIEDERFNMLARLRYLDDAFGQTIDGVAGAGDIQESIVVSVEGNYDIDPRWTLGAKLGYRMTESGPDETSLVTNDALLAVANARYHLVHRWDALVEVRQFEAFDAGLTETSLLGAVYRQVGQGTQVGVGYNFGSFSDDLTDLTLDDQGLFLNVSTSF